MFLQRDLPVCIQEQKSLKAYISEHLHVREFHGQSMMLASFAGLRNSFEEHLVALLGHKL